MKPDTPALEERLHLTQGLFPDSLREALSIQKAVAAKNLFDASLEEAFNIQLALLPAEPLRFPAMEVGYKFRPAGVVSGDFLDYFPITDQLVALYLGDVSGKGLPAALYAALAMGTLRGIIKEGQTPAAVLEFLNRRLSDRNATGRYCAVQYAVFDQASRQLCFANAGLAPLPLHQSRTGYRELGGGGFPCGIFRDVHYDLYTTQLASGEAVLFSTDGLTEAQDRAEQEFGLQRMIQVCDENRNESVETLLNRLFEAVDRFAAGAPQHDDMTVAALRFV